MEIKNKTNAVAYTAPECKAVELELQGMICTSNGWGENGGAGGLDNGEDIDLDA